MNWGFTSGYGLEWRRSRFTPGLEYRFSLGFTDLRPPTGPGFPEIELKNVVQAFSLSAGLR